MILQENGDIDLENGLVAVRQSDISVGCGYSPGYLVYYKDDIFPVRFYVKFDSLYKEEIMK